MKQHIDLLFPNGEPVTVEMAPPQMVLKFDPEEVEYEPNYVIRQGKPYLISIGLIPKQKS